MATKEIANTAFAQTVLYKASLGAANGVAELDATGKLKAAQLPAGVDDVVEAANFAALPATGETNKIYVTLDDNKTFRWGGTVYVEISASLALGETSSTAYRGDRGKAAYDHSIAPHETVGAGAAAVTEHESDYDHDNFQQKLSEGAFVNGDKTKLDNIEAGATANTKATGAEIAAGTDDTKFATAKALKDSGTVWLGETSRLVYDGTEGCVKLEFNVV